jgi:hypothetical protein
VTRSLLALSFPLPLLLACQAGGMGNVMGTAPSRPSSQLPYGQQPTWWTDPMGFYETGLALGDINGDHFPDLVVSSGNDRGWQALAVYLNDGQGVFPKRPDWMSEDLDSNGNLALGDINGDGWLDVAVVTLGNDVGQGRVKVYFNRPVDGRGELEKRPSYQSGDRFSGFSCALGDADGDGDLDLAVSVLGEAAQLYGYQRLYFNEGGGKLATLPGWKSSEKMLGGAILFADVQQDGVMDLIVGAEQVNVYAGSPVEGGGSQLPATPWWSSEKGVQVPWVDVGPLGPQRTWGLVASRNNVLCISSGQSGCDTPRYQAFVPSPGHPEALWSSSSRGLGSGVKLADADGDGVLDLLGGSWGTDALDGGPLEIYLGGGGAFASTPAFSSDPKYNAQIQSLDVANLNQQCLGERVWEHTFTGPQSVITLPDQLIGQLGPVEKNGAVLDARQYTSVPGAAWVSFAQRLQAGDTLRIQYTSPSVFDIALANFDCGIGNYVYYSGATSRCAPARSTTPP